MTRILRIRCAHIVIFLGLIMQGCVVQPTAEGNAIRLIDKQSDYGCKYVSTVTGSGSVGWTTAHDAEGAMNEVRNRAAVEGGNAIRIVNIDSSMSTTVVVAEVLTCNFNDGAYNS